MFASAYFCVWYEERNTETYRFPRFSFPIRTNADITTYKKASYHKSIFSVFI